MASTTRAPRHEVLEAGPYGDRTPAGVEIPDALGCGRHLAHGRQACSRRRREARRQALECRGRTGEQKLVILATARGPGECFALERLCDCVHRGLHGEPGKLYTGPDPALAAE